MPLLWMASVSAASAQQPPSSPLIVVGRVLVVNDHYLVFTTGDAVRLGAVTVPPGAALGSTVRVRIDLASHLVRSVELDDAGPQLGEIDASALPRDVVAVDPRSARSASAGSAKSAGASAGQVTVRIDVAVPDVTPPSDDVYLSTERSNFASAELRMNRVDAFHWTVSLPLASGGTLRYVFTRGAPATVERRRNGTIVTPRELTAAPALHERDRVERWADRF